MAFIDISIIKGLLLELLAQRLQSVNAISPGIPIFQLEIIQVFLTPRKHELHPAEVILCLLPQLGIPLLYQPAHIQVLLQLLDSQIEVKEPLLRMLLLLDELAERHAHALQYLVHLPLLRAHRLHYSVDFTIELYGGLKTLKKGDLLDRSRRAKFSRA